MAANDDRQLSYYNHYNKSSESDLPPWKKHLIARLRVKNNKHNNIGNSALTVTTGGNTTTATTIDRIICPPSSTAGRAPIAGIQQQPSTSSTSCCSSSKVVGRQTQSSSSSLLRSTSTSSGATRCSSDIASSENVDSSLSSLTNTVNSGAKSALSSSDTPSLFGGNAIKKKMVQERCWTDYNDASCTDSMETVSENYENNYCCKTSDSDSSEELHYGPGIVSKLKNKYLSLALRRCDNYGVKKRPSILRLRKATSLEDLLDDEDDEDEDYPSSRGVLKNDESDGRHRTTKIGFDGRGYDKKTTVNGCGGFFDKNFALRNNRYRNSRRGAQEIKRARSVEAISRFENNLVVSPPPVIEKTRPKSLHMEYNNLPLIGDESMKGNEDDECDNRKPKADKLSGTLENNSSSQNCPFIINNANNNIINNKNKDNNHVVPPRLNRPRRIAPIMNEREKPPADVVKQAKMIFEKRPEQRTKPPATTGEVAAKIASYKNIIVQSKPVKTKPPIKTKPTAECEKNGKTKNNGVAKTTAAVAKTTTAVAKTTTAVTKTTTAVAKTTTAVVQNGNNKKSPITDDEKKMNVVVATEKMKIAEKNDVNNKENKKQQISGDTNGVNEEIAKTIPRIKEMSKKDKINKLEIEENLVAQLPSPIPDVSLIEFAKSDSEFARLCETPDLIMTATPTAVSTPHRDDVAEKNASDCKNSSANCANKKTNKKNRNDENGAKTAIIIDTETYDVHHQDQRSPTSPSSCSISSDFCQISPIPPCDSIQSQQQPAQLPRRKVLLSPPIVDNDKGGVVLSSKEEERNVINAAKITCVAQKTGVGRCGKKDEDRKEDFVPKKVRRPPVREPETNSIVFKFTDRKDVPDYVQNDRTRIAGRLEKPKVGEGGIILLPGASIDESFTDEDEEIMRFLQAPPSPCDVTFINDNILIDGKSSINQKTKKSRMRISFVESGPDVFEYPSESSLLVDEQQQSPISPTSVTPMAGHTVPMLSGSTLANYTPKSTETFQPGVTRSVPNNVPALAPASPQTQKENLPDDSIDHPLLEEVDQPITFSAGTNSDMLF